MTPPITPVRHPALSLWQSIVHRALGKADGGDGLHETADHPAMIATANAAQAIEAGVLPTEPATIAAAPAPHDGGTASLYRAGAALYARLAVAKFERNEIAIRTLQDEIRDSMVDPRWADLLYQFEKSLVTGRAESYFRHQTMDDFILAPMPDAVTIALVADWGTGSPHARAILEQIASLRPDIVVHLGDVYFSGRPEEVRAHFIGLFDDVFGPSKPRILTLAGNHDRYSGGAGFVELLAAIDQPASYFAVQNQHWQILGMDTGLHDFNPRLRGSNITGLEDTELAWHLDKVARFGRDKRTILLSHHQLFSAAATGHTSGGGPLCVNPKLHAGFGPILDQIAFWFWGHEHNFSLSAPYAGLARGRGIGSGASPTLVQQRPYEPAPGLVLPEGETAPPVLLPDTRLADNGVIYNHAFAMLRLDGKRATATYYQSDTTGATPGRAPPLPAPILTETVLAD